MFELLFGKRSSRVRGKESPSRIHCTATANGRSLDK